MKLKVTRIVVDILMFLALILVLVTPYLMRANLFSEATLARRGIEGNSLRPWEFLGWNLSTWHQNIGWLLAALMVLHLVLNFKWILATLKNFKRLSQSCKINLVVMLLLIITMTISIVSGAIWGARPGPIDRGGATQVVRVVHILSSWAAVWVTGIHMGLHLTRFFAFFKSKKKKESA